MNNNVIETYEVCKAYKIDDKNIDVLKNITIQVKKCEFLSIMGPSGSGKSTLLYMLGAMDNVTSGKINVFGNDVTKFNDKQLSKLRVENIGFIFQSFNLVQNLSVEENIMLPYWIRHKVGNPDRKKLDDIIEIVGLKDRRKHKPYQLSGGQQQRVAIGRALINDPDIILADEPTGNLDSKMGKEIMDLLLELNRRGKTIIHVTHSLDCAKYGTRIVHINDGVIVKEEHLNIT